VNIWPVCHRYIFNASHESALSLPRPNLWRLRADAAGSYDTLWGSKQARWPMKPTQSLVMGNESLTFVSSGWVPQLL